MPAEEFKPDRSRKTPPLTEPEKDSSAPAESDDFGPAEVIVIPKDGALEFLHGECFALKTGPFLMLLVQQACKPDVYQAALGDFLQKENVCLSIRKEKLLKSDLPPLSNPKSPRTSRNRRHPGRLSIKHNPVLKWHERRIRNETNLKHVFEDVFSGRYHKKLAEARRSAPTQIVKLPLSGIAISIVPCNSAREVEIQNFDTFRNRYEQLRSARKDVDTKQQAIAVLQQTIAARQQALDLQYQAVQAERDQLIREQIEPLRDEVAEQLKQSSLPTEFRAVLSAIHAQLESDVSSGGTVAAFGPHPSILTTTGETERESAADVSFDELTLPGVFRFLETFQEHIGGFSVAVSPLLQRFLDAVASIDMPTDPLFPTLPLKQQFARSLQQTLDQLGLAIVAENKTVCRIDAYSGGGTKGGAFRLRSSRDSTEASGATFPRCSLIPKSYLKKG